MYNQVLFSNFCKIFDFLWHFECCEFLRMAWGGLSEMSRKVEVQDAKLSKRCQLSKNQTPGLWRRFTKKINWHNEVQRYWHKFWCHIWRSSKLVKNTFCGHFEGYWWQSYVMSKLTSIFVNLIVSTYFFVNLLHSPGVCFLTFDIFWHFDSLLKPPQLLTGWGSRWKSGGTGHLYPKLP